MKLGRILAFIYVVASIVATLLSANIMGTGMWGWLFLGAGLVVGVSPYMKTLIPIGRIIALVFGIIAVCAVLLGLVAATIGGSFHLENKEALLLLLFAVIGITGIAYGKPLIKR